LGKLAKGYLATSINITKQRVMYPINTTASIHHVWSAQFSQCEDCAVFNSPTAVDEWLSDIDFTKFPTTAPKVKLQLVSGVITDVWCWSNRSDDWTEIKIHKTLLLLCDNLKDAYGDTCELLKPLKRFDKVELERWMLDAASELRSQRIHDPSKELAAKSVVAGINKALARYYDDNTSSLQKWYKRTVPHDDGAGQLTLVRTWKPSFRPKTDFATLLGSARPIIPAYSSSSGHTPREPRTTLPRPPATQRGPSRSTRRSNSIQEGQPLRDSLTRFLDKPFPESMERHPWLKELSCGDKPVCGPFLFNNKEACKGDCAKVHLDREGKVHRR
jgi:hypothetical protein